MRCLPRCLGVSMCDNLAQAGVQRVKLLGAGDGNRVIRKTGSRVLHGMCGWIVDEGEPAIDSTETPPT